MSCVHPLHSLQRWTITQQATVFSSISNGLLMCLNKTTSFFFFFLNVLSLGHGNYHLFVRQNAFCTNISLIATSAQYSGSISAPLPFDQLPLAGYFAGEMRRLHHQRRLWCMTRLTRLINDLSKAHTNGLGKDCRHREEQAGRGMRGRAESESRTLKLQMVSLTGVIIIGNYTALVILCLHNVWYFSSNFSYTSHYKGALNMNGYRNRKEQHIQAVRKRLNWNWK